MDTHHSDNMFSRKVGNLFVGLCENILFLLFQSNVIHFLILPWTCYGGMVGYWFSHINHIFAGIYILPLQLWDSPDNFSGNNVINKLITGICSVAFPIGRYSRSKLGARRVVKKGVLRGIDGIRT